MHSSSSPLFLSAADRSFPCMDDYAFSFASFSESGSSSTGFYLSFSSPFFWSFRPPSLFSSFSCFSSSSTGTPSSGFTPSSSSSSCPSRTSSSLIRSSYYAKLSCSCSSARFLNSSTWFSKCTRVSRSSSSVFSVLLAGIQKILGSCCTTKQSAGKQ